MLLHRLCAPVSVLASAVWTHPAQDTPTSLHHHTTVWADVGHGSALGPERLEERMRLPACATHRLQVAGKPTQLD